MRGRPCAPSWPPSCVTSGADVLHSWLKDALDAQCAAALLEPVTLCRDALRADPLTVTGDEPLVNARRVITALLSDPLLQAHIDWADRAVAARRRAARYCALDTM
jgi:hypothetical protein